MNEKIAITVSIDKSLWEWVKMRMLKTRSKQYEVLEGLIRAEMEREARDGRNS
jgi:hypothetical protein